MVLKRCIEELVSEDAVNTSTHATQGVRHGCSGGGRGGGGGAGAGKVG